MGAIEEGREAEQLLKNAAFRRALERTRQLLYEDWKNTEPWTQEGTDKREILFYRNLALEQVVQQLQLAVDNAKIARKREH